MKHSENYIRAYHDFKDSVDFTKKGILPELDNLIGLMLMGVPTVPADEDKSPEGLVTAIDQRVSILKMVFAEVNQAEPEAFIDKGLLIYDQAGKMAKTLLQQTSSASESVDPNVA